jgi:hypothetical protein
VERILRFAKELSLKIELYASVITFEKWNRICEVNKLLSNTTLFEIEELDDFFIINTKKSKNDLVVFCSARTGGVSYNAGIDSFPSKIEKGYLDNDSIVIYPSQNTSENLYGNYEDFDSSAISKGVEAIQKIGKEVGNIFKKGN